MIYDIALADYTPPPIITIQQVQEEAPEEPKTEPTKYVVKKNDNLSKIAKAHGTTWQRLFYKNVDITDPNNLEVGAILIIPEADEELKERHYTIPAPKPVKTAPVRSKGIVSGNTYSYGYCTWFVKNMRPDLPNNLGNANSWYYRAQAQGLPVGTEPVVGAVGTTTRGALGHVVYITGVDGDTVTLVEMNYAGWGVQSTRTAHKSEFLYIY